MAKGVAWICIGIGAVMVVTLRIIGIDLTEGQLLIQYAPTWVIGGCLVFVGLILMWADGL